MVDWTLYVLRQRRDGTRVQSARARVQPNEDAALVHSVPGSGLKSIGGVSITTSLH